MSQRSIYYRENTANFQAVFNIRPHPSCPNWRTSCKQLGVPVQQQGSQKCRQKAKRPIDCFFNQQVQKKRKIRGAQLMST